MAAVFSNNGEIEILSRALYATPQPTYYVHLYQNNFEPFPEMANDASDFLECTFDGYTPQSLTGWSLPTTDAGVASTQADEVSFTREAGSGGAQLAYGYYITSDFAGTDLLWAEYFSAGPFNFSAVGVTRRVSPTVTLRTLEP